MAGDNITLTPNADENRITISSAHPSITKSTDTTSTASPSAGDTFTAVDSVTRDENGHVTTINTKTITLPNTSVAVDSALSSTSTNPVQNKVVNSALEEKLSLSGGTMTGDVVIPITKSSVESSLPVAGSTMSIKDITSLSDYKTYLGTYIHSGAWYNLISIRHRNGCGDGSSYGMYLRTPLAEGSNLTWGKQYGASSWEAERTILDSSNYKTYCTPAKIGAAASSHTHSYAGSSSAGGSATSAVKLDSSAGSATQPVYFSDGKPVACTYTLGKKVTLYSGSKVLANSETISLSDDCSNYDEIHIFAYVTVDSMENTRKFVLIDKFMSVDKGRTGRYISGGIYYNSSYNCCVGFDISSNGKTLTVRESQCIGYTSVVCGCVLGIKY